LVKRRSICKFTKKSLKSPTTPLIILRFLYHAQGTFRNHAFDFLLKPINLKDLDSIIRRMQEEGVSQQLQTNGKIYKAEENLPFFVNSNDFRAQFSIV
jgi:DNA-binding NtrC family response regulator